MENKTKISQADIDWENRILCSDGNCIGIIGADGRCKECGLLFEGDLPAAKTVKKPDTETARTEPAEPVTTSHEEIETADNLKEEPVPAADDDWENRRLCSDGNCIGVIGPDGNCKECGLKYRP